MATSLRLARRIPALLRIVSLALCVLILLPACSTPSRLRARSRYAHGVVYILPGIEGRSVFNRNIALGLDEGGVTSAIEVYDWTTGVPGLYLANLVIKERNERAARQLARRISDYRRRYPHGAVHLIGHSGGGGVAVLALESLPRSVRVDCALLLAPALSPDYDLSPALRHTRLGICNFYSSLDVGFLGVGTTVFGSIDRDRGPSAGAIGFEPPDSLDDEETQLYRDLLRQVKWSRRLFEYGATGTHMGWTTRSFARSYLAPLIQSQVSDRPLPPGFFDE